MCGAFYVKMIQEYNSALQTTYCQMADIHADAIAKLLTWVNLWTQYVVMHFFWQKGLKAASHRIRLRLTNRLMANTSLPTCSKNTIADNHGNPAYLKQF